MKKTLLSSAIFLSFYSQASVDALTEPVKGLPASVTEVEIVNLTAPNLNPTEGDTLEVRYVFTDPDGLTEDKALSTYGWMADGNLIGEAISGNSTFIPASAQLDKYLSVQVTAAESAPSDPDRATMVESAPTRAPVLPPRSEFESLYHFSSGANMRWGDAYMYCANRNERLMTTGELQELFVDFTRATSAPAAENNNDLRDTYGIGLSNVAWAATGYDSYHDYVYIATDGHISSNSNATTVEVACARFGGAEGLPTVTNVNVPDPVIGTALTATYTYNGNPTIPDRSRFQWYRADDAAGTGKTAITGATAVTYTPVAEDAGKWLIIEITPASYDTVVGTKVSDASGVAVAQPITITDALIEKPTDARQSFEVMYTVLGGTESGTTYQWYWKGEAVQGATAKTFTFPTLTIPSASDTEELSVEVTPRDSNGQSGTMQRVVLGLRSSIAWNPPFGQGTWYDMAKTCAGQSNGNKRPGTTAELTALLDSLGSLAAYGVNTSNSYWTGTKGSGQGSHQRVQMSNGNITETSDTGTGERGLCVAGSAPAAPAFGDILVNGQTFSGTNFPTTGFAGAYFEFKGLKDSNANDWTYRSTDTSNAIVFNDNNWYAGVQLQDEGSTTIEVYNIAGGNPKTYTVNPGKWFGNKDRAEVLSTAGFICGDNGVPVGSPSYSLPPPDSLTPATSPGVTPSRAIGSLWGEWGDVSRYGWSFPAGHSYYWAGGEFATPTNPYNVSLQHGTIDISSDYSQKKNVVCKYW